MREKERKEWKGEKEREKREKRREKERKGEKKMSRVNYYQSAFNLQKEKTMFIGRNAQNLKKLPGPVVDHYSYKSSCRS